jgi:hypothetical protein
MLPTSNSPTDFNIWLSFNQYDYMTGKAILKWIFQNWKIGIDFKLKPSKDNCGIYLRTMEDLLFLKLACGLH